MTGTTKTMDMQMSIITRSTVASVSKVDYSKKNVAKDATGFDGLLNKASSAVIQAKSTTTNMSFSSTKKLVERQDQTKNNLSDKNLSKNVNDSTSKANNPKDQKVDGNSKEVNTKDVNDKSQVADNKNLDKTSQTETKNTKETLGKEANEKLQKAIEEDGRELIGHMADMLDISEDEILDAMEMLGLMMADLLNPQNIRELITNLDTQDKALDLITDADLNMQMQDLLEGAEGMKSELVNEFDLSDKEVLEAINDNTAKVDPELRNVRVKEPEIVLHVAKEELPQDLKASQSKDFTSDIKVETPTISGDEEFKPVENTAQTEKQNNGNSNSGAEHQENNAGTSLFNQLLNNITENVNVNPTGPAEYTNRAQMENIIRQITDKITINASANETSMELQLHPASLGNVNILLTSSKDGITAKFTAQNEIVKEAVEAQMLTLQQKFNEQGIKVTSIEVTIASHAFEQNLQQGNDNNEASNQQQRGKSKTLRRINLTEGLDELTKEDEMTDADRIAAQMMAANGNSVDFSA